MQTNSYRITAATPTKALLQSAESNPYDEQLLKKIYGILATRNNDYALMASIRIGELLESIRTIQRHYKSSEGLFLDETGQPLAHQWPDVECLARVNGYHQQPGYFDDDGLGLMSYVGYHVGQNGQPRNIRQKILDCVFHNPLPNVQSEGYMSEWGEPMSRQRLNKMKSFLVYYSENPGRGDFRKAIQQWQEDLDYISERYDSRFKLF